MAEEKKHSRKLTFRELADKHGHAVDPSDLYQRSRNKRMLDNLYAAGLKLEEPNISDVARGSAIKATQDYLDRTGGKPITPIEQTLNVVHKSPEESAASILEMLGQRRKEAASLPQPSKPSIQ